MTVGLIDRRRGLTKLVGAGRAGLEDVGFQTLLAGYAQAYFQVRGQTNMEALMGSGSDLLSCPAFRV